MPLVDFHCRSCGRVIEKLVSRNEKDPTLCDPAEPNAVGAGGCGCETLERLKEIPRTSFALKGSGWFKTGGY